MVQIYWTMPEACTLKWEKMKGQGTFISWQPSLSPSQQPSLSPSHQEGDMQRICPLHVSLLMQKPTSTLPLCQLLSMFNAPLLPKVPPITTTAVGHGWELVGGCCCPAHYIYTTSWSSSASIQYLHQGQQKRERKMKVCRGGFRGGAPGARAPPLRKTCMNNLL